MSFRSLIPSSCRKNAKQMQVDLLDGSANTFQTNVCSDYSVWIWTLVSRCCAHIAVLSGGLAHINQSVMRENSCECICNYSLINQMNSGCLTSNYPTRSLFQARKKKAKETITISVTIKKKKLRTKCRFDAQIFTTTQVFHQDELQEQWPTGASSIIIKGSREQSFPPLMLFHMLRLWGGCVHHIRD